MPWKSKYAKNKFLADKFRQGGFPVAGKIIESGSEVPFSAEEAEKEATKYMSEDSFSGIKKAPPADPMVREYLPKKEKPANLGPFRQLMRRKGR